MKMADVLGDEIGSFFQDLDESKKRVVFSTSDAVESDFPNLRREAFIRKSPHPLT